MKNKKTGSVITTIILLAICIALAAAVIVKMFQPNEEIDFRRGQATDGDTAVNVYVQAIEPSDFTNTLKFYGTVKDDSDTVGIIARTSGYVTEILVEEDDRVEEGQVIGYVDPSSPGSSYQKSAVVARVAGTIDEISVTVGEYISSGTVFATETEEAEYIVDLNVPEKYLDNIVLGSKAFISSTVRSSVAGAAYLTNMSSKIDKANRTVAVEMTPEITEGLLDGLVVTMDFVIEEQNDVIVIPTSVISTLGEKSYVYVINNGVAEQREIVTGSSNNTSCVVLSGLSTGDLVVVDGSVTEGASVNIVER